ncbi:hypothetical protein TraAM80_06435, partial [Trypanosoma rangeli]
MVTRGGNLNRWMLLRWHGAFVGVAAAPRRLLLPREQEKHQHDKANKANATKEDEGDRLALVLVAGRTTGHALRRNWVADVDDDIAEKLCHHHNRRTLRTERAWKQL